MSELSLSIIRMI